VPAALHARDLRRYFQRGGCAWGQALHLSGDGAALRGGGADDQQHPPGLLRLRLLLWLLLLRRLRLVRLVRLLPLLLLLLCLASQLACRVPRRRRSLRAAAVCLPWQGECMAGVPAYERGRDLGPAEARGGDDEGVAGVPQLAEHRGLKGEEGRGAWGAGRRACVRRCGVGLHPWRRSGILVHVCGNALPIRPSAPAAGTAETVAVCGHPAPRSERPGAVVLFEPSANDL
jgi:hypothetical protein